MTRSRADPKAPLTSAPFGDLPGGGTASIFALVNRHMRVGITDFGGRIVSLECEDHDGKWDHIVLGFESAAEYATSKGAFGALLGRTANRIGGACFSLDGHV